MKQSVYLFAALIFFVVSFVLACSTTIDPKCTHRALYQAISFNEVTSYPVRIAIGPSELGLHAQAQAQRPDGKWEWLEQGDFGVGTGYKDRVPGFEPNQYVTVQEFLQRMGYSTSLVSRTAEGGVWTTGDYSSSRTIYDNPVIDR